MLRGATLEEVSFLCSSDAPRCENLLKKWAEDNGVQTILSTLRARFMSVGLGDRFEVGFPRSRKRFQRTLAGSLSTSKLFCRFSSIPQTLAKLAVNPIAFFMSSGLWLATGMSS